MGSPLRSRRGRLRRSRRPRCSRGLRRSWRRRCSRGSRGLRRSWRSGYLLFPIEIRREIAFAERAFLEHEPAHRLEGLAALGALVYSRATGSICWSETHRLPSLSVGCFDAFRTALRGRVLSCSRFAGCAPWVEREMAMSREPFRFPSHAEMTTLAEADALQVRGRGATRIKSRVRFWLRTIGLRG